MIAVLRGVAELRAWRATRGDVGLVPTMGALHAGHRSLAERSVADGATTVASIFVNPTQFGPGEDYRAYPRSEDADLALLERSGVDAVFIPSVAEMYPEGDDVRVDPGPIAARLEGAHRPGHFSGVATVVTKLFAMVEPRRAYFGQKDFQQLRVIQTLVRERSMPVRVIACPTVREPDGLALSSRNAYLSSGERIRATALSRGLFTAQRAWHEGLRGAKTLRELATEHAASAGELDYVSVADPLTLEELDGIADRAVVLVACRVGRARLIDNILVGMSLQDLS